MTTLPPVLAASAPIPIVPPGSPAKGSSVQGKSPHKASPRLISLLEQHPQIDGSLFHSQVVGGTFTTSNGTKIEFTPECKIDEEDEEGRTAMDVAKEKGNATALAILQESKTEQS